MSLCGPRTGGRGSSFAWALAVLLAVALLTLTLSGCAWQEMDRLSDVYQGYEVEHLGKPYVIVHGAVRSAERRHILWFQGMSLRNAIETAGGPVESADTRHVYLVRGAGTETQKVMWFDYRAVCLGGEPDQPLIPGDIIWFDRDLFWKLGSPIRMLLGAGQVAVEAAD